MIIIVNLQDTLNPISAAERVKVNQNWAELRRGFSSLQNQISFLSGGEDVDAIIQRIDDAIAKAETDTQTAIDNVNNNYQELSTQINQSLTELSDAITSAETAIQQAGEATTETISATNDARAAIAELNGIVNDFRNLGDYNSATAYKRNNMVSFEGQTYIALQDNTNVPLSNTSTWNLFAARGERGEKGDTGETGAALSIQGTLNDVSELPSTGSAGQAYTVNGELYVWSENTNQWENVGNIKGEKGDRGDIGPQGPPGDTPDLTPIQNQLDNHESRITVLENTETTTKADVAGLNREVAYLKLQQEASERIEGGTVFAENFNGSRFGFTLNESESQNFVIRDGKLIMIESGGSGYNITNALVSSTSNSLGGVGGRKIVMLDNGNLVAATISPNTPFYEFHLSTNGGSDWQLKQSTGAVSTDIALETDGTRVFATFAATTGISFRSFDSNLDNILMDSVVATGQASVTNVTMKYRTGTNTIDVVWGSLHGGGSQNLRYSRSDNLGTTWSGFTNITNVSGASQSHTKPAMALTGNFPIVANRAQLGATNIQVYTWRYNGSSWSSGVVGSTSAFEPNGISIISGNGNELHLAYCVKDSTSNNIDYVRYSRSTNSGDSWSTVQRITPGSNSTISVNSEGVIFIVFDNNNSTYRITSSDNGTSWSDPELIGLGTNPNSLQQKKFVFASPPSLRLGDSGVLYSGNYNPFVEIPALNSTIVYDIPSTEYVGAFVQRIGNVNVTAYLNDTLMDSELNSNEYMFEGSLSVASSAKLRLQLTRANVSGGENDALTRILGGRS